MISSKRNAFINVGGLGKAEIELVLVFEIKEGRTRITFKNFNFPGIKIDSLFGSAYPSTPGKLNMEYLKE